MSTHGPGPTPSAVAPPRSARSNSPNILDPANASALATTDAADASATCQRDRDAPVERPMMRSSDPATRFRAREMSSPAACGTGSKSMGHPAHARTTLKSHRTSASPNTASLCARCTASPTTLHSLRCRSPPTGQNTAFPEATPTVHGRCPRCTIAARAANANAVAIADGSQS